VGNLVWRGLVGNACGKGDGRTSVRGRVRCCNGEGGKSGVEDAFKTKKCACREGFEGRCYGKWTGMQRDTMRLERAV